MHNPIQVGHVHIQLHRTVRVAADNISNLPPSLGYFDTFKVSDFRETCPDYWENEAIFIVLHDKEAMWLGFEAEHIGETYVPPTPSAMLVGAGNINALTGKRLTTKLEKGNYLVTPPQPWLDGWKNEDGTISQFVATEFKKGEGLSVGEQLGGKECRTGGIGIAVFAPKNPEKLKSQEIPDESACLSSISSCMSYGTKSFCNFSEMALGKGGKILQKIYPDPYGLEEWNEKPAGLLSIYIVNAEQFSKITGEPIPPLPKSFEEYYGLWFGLKDKDKKDVQGSKVFTNLKKAF